MTSFTKIDLGDRPGPEPSGEVHQHGDLDTPTFDEGDLLDHGSPGGERFAANDDWCWPLNRLATPTKIGVRYLGLRPPRSPNFALTQSEGFHA